MDSSSILFITQQKFLIICESSSHRPAENLKMVMAYVGIVWATYFAKVSFAVCDIYFSDQSEHFFDKFSFVGWNFSSFIPPSGVGSPSYQN